MSNEAGDGDIGIAAVGARGASVVLSRCFAWCTVAAMSAFLLNNYLTNWRDWPGPTTIFAAGSFYAWIQAGLYALFLAIALAFVARTPTSVLRPDAMRLYGISAFIVRAAFWAVLLIGLADMVVSFLRVEGLLPAIVGDHLTTELGLSRFRGAWVHFPMAIVGILIATRARGFGFHWLALLVAGAELLIVLSRFIYSYEQAFMADLVRFWYGAMFLFASAYTLLHEGHVRVDILYANMSDRAKAWSNTIGSLLLGTPVCWVILTLGMSGRTNVITSPLLNYEITQAGFGLYVKYLMAGFLAIYALTMLLQFMSYFLNSVGFLLHEPDAHAAPPEEAHV